MVFGRNVVMLLVFLLAVVNSLQLLKGVCAI